ncbi:MAG: flavodoxin family protein [Anaerolineae bacterium]|nr:flavodoxin family protein [Chloroflexota bacterium]
MVKALVVYDSVFGNTEQVAHAIGDALGSPKETETLRVTDAEPEALTKVDVLVVGSPTRGFRATPATKNLLKRIPAGGLRGVRVAAFDTRFAVEEMDSALLKFLVGLFGYAAKPIADRLRRKGGELAVPPEGFIVEGTEGPLREGELERAAEWARQILEAE